ncbi:MAG TPA: endo-1,4-beta-xylanase [Candidatus Saccharimonadales bacterium]|nr:endo-1,4-beta-xylanase [Candidatus Saccharimonadales bacterium]
MLAVILIIGTSFGLFLYDRSFNEKLNNTVLNSTDELSVNLLANQAWSKVAGASFNNEGVKITPLDRAIVNQDGSDNQLNPPVNVSGTHLRVRGDFRMQLVSHNAPSSTGSLRLYGQVPVIYDEWRYETPSVEIKQSTNSIEISIWDGTDDQPVYQQSYPINIANNNTLFINHLSNRIIISAKNHIIATMKDRAIFNSGEIWFGTDAAVGSTGWTIKSLTAGSLNNGQVALAKPLSNGSKHSSNDLNILSKRLPIGAAVSLYPLMTNQSYRELALNQFSTWTTENDLKPQFIHPQPNTYSFNDADQLVDTALANGIRVHGHTLVFGEANPKWMQNTLLDKRQQVMIDHITQVVNHFKGKITEWDVINEPLSDNDSDYGLGKTGLRHHIWWQAMGPNYIDIALRTAHAVDPTAKLYINDYALEVDGDRWDAMIQLLQGLKQRGVPLDGVGFESHIHESRDLEDKVTIIRHMHQLAQMGLSVRISEVDAYGDDLASQTQQYQAVLEACLVSSNCTSYTTWGISDAYGSTTNLHVYPLDYGNDLLWDSSFQPKPAVGVLQNELKTSTL